ncbi:3',5'-cyclic-nucleotide phosphodiesterase [Methylorubrum populi]
MRPAMTHRPALLAALLLGGAFAVGAARADNGPPNLDVDATCRSAERAQVSLNDNANKDACLHSERDAQADLKKRWNQFPAAAKSQCSNQFQAGGFPSYVELITCLELASGSVPTQPSQDGSATSDVGGKTSGGRKQGSTLTREPSPAQRTNPIEVLQDR